MANKIYKINGYVVDGSNESEHEVIDTYTDLTEAQKDFKYYETIDGKDGSRCEFELVCYLVNEDGEEEFDDILETTELPQYVRWWQGVRKWIITIIWK